MASDPVADVVIRPLTPDDAPSLLDLQLALDAESAFMLLEPGERKQDPAGVREQLEDMAAGRDPSYVLGAFDGARAVGYADVSVLPYARAARTGYVVMGVRASSAGSGIGRALLESAAARGAERGLRRLELTVMEHNRAALGLYLGCGFQVEGRRRSALFVDGDSVTEYYMGRLLS